MFERNKISAVILAGGSGTRMTGDIPKQYLEIGGKPILNYSVDAFESAGCIDEIILVVPPGKVEYCRQNIVERGNYDKISKIVEGGATRQESSLKGVLAADSASDFVMIHDGARPFIQRDEIEKMAEKLAVSHAVIMAVPVKDTIKKISPAETIEETLERKSLWAALTPQAFKRELIIEAHKYANEIGFQGTDDASLVEIMGKKVNILKGSYLNIKITTKEDMVFAEAILAHRRGKN